MHFSSLILSLIFPALFANIVLAIPLDPRDSDNSGNAYTGTGGQAPGGSVDGSRGLINLFSGKYYYMRAVLNSNINIPEGNAGDGGDARSGSAMGRVSRAGGDNSGNAYTGAGGSATGGSVIGGDGGILDLFSGMSVCALL